MIWKDLFVYINIIRTSYRRGGFCMKHKVITAVMSLLLMGSLWIPAGLVANAEEIAVAGYHDYSTT